MTATLDQDDRDDRDDDSGRTVDPRLHRREHRLALALRRRPDPRVPALHALPDLLHRLRVAAPAGTASAPMTFVGLDNYVTSVGDEYFRISL